MAEQHRVLVVDDDEDTLNTYVDVLKDAGYAVTQATNGLEGLEKINEQQPDIILSGIIMPQMDGFTFVETLKKNVTTSSIPIIFLSHLGRQEDEDRSRELGVDDFIVRDITTFPEVLSRVRALLTSTEYLVALDPSLYDGRKFAREMGLPENFVCSTGEGDRYILRLRLTDASKKQLSAEIICA